MAGRRRGQHLLALLAYGCLSLAMFGPWILGRMTTWFLSASTQDGSIFVWMFRWWPHAITHGINPLHTTAAWAPTGINLAWVTSVPLPAVALSPVTAVSGPFFSFNLVELAAPALAAWTAYLLCRHLAGAFLPALAGGFFFGFSPYLIDEFGMGHPNLSLVFLVPLAAYLVVRLLDGSLPARLVIPLLGVVLGAQLYISTETFATLTLMGGLFALIGLAAGPVWRQRLRAAIGPVAGAYAVAAVLGIPLFYALAAWPRPYKPILFATIGHGAQSGSDFLRYLIPGQFTLLWDGSHWGGYGNPWYLGVALIALLVVFALTERRRRGTWLLVAGLLVTLVLSIGDTLAVFGAHILPWRLAAALPLLSSAQPGRLVVYAFLLIAVIMARWLARPRRPVLRWALAAAAALLILPNFPGQCVGQPGAGPGLPDPGDLPPLPAARGDRLDRQPAPRPADDLAGANGLLLPAGGRLLRGHPLRPARPARRRHAGAPGHRRRHRRLGGRHQGLPGRPPGRRGADGRAAARLGRPPRPGRRDRRRGRPVRPGDRVPAPGRAHRVTSKACPACSAGQAGRLGSGPAAAIVRPEKGMRP